MPANNWGEVLDAMRGLDSKIATPIKRAIAMIEDLQAAEGALGTATAGLAAIEGQRVAEEQARDAALAASRQAQEQAAQEIARCRSSIAQAQADEQAVVTASEKTRARVAHEALVQAAALAEEFETRERQMDGEITALTATRDALVAEIADFRRRMGAL